MLLFCDIKLRRSEEGFNIVEIVSRVHLAVKNNLFTTGMWVYFVRIKAGKMWLLLLVRYFVLCIDQ